MPEIMGAGVALIDYDNDGDLDVYLIQGKGKRGNRLFRNNLLPSGRLHFTDVTQAAGVGLAAYGMGVATGDYGNDGYTDLYITNFGPNVLFHNNGNGAFTDVTVKAGVGDARWSRRDPDEPDNLAVKAEHQSTLRRLRTATIAELRRTKAGFVDHMPAVREAIRAGA